MGGLTRLAPDNDLGCHVTDSPLNSVCDLVVAQLSVWYNILTREGNKLSAGHTSGLEHHRGVLGVFLALQEVLLVLGLPLLDLCEEARLDFFNKVSQFLLAQDALLERSRQTNE